MLQEYTHKCAIAWWGTNQNTDFHLQNFVFKNNTQFSILNKFIYFFWLFFSLNTITVSPTTPKHSKKLVIIWIIFSNWDSITVWKRDC